MLIDRTEYFLDRMAHTVAVDRIKGNSTNFTQRFPLLEREQLNYINLKAAMIVRKMKGR